jgi:hypothetical protein
MINLLLVYPVGTGPSTETFSANVFRLPAGYIRKAPQAPKDGSKSILGAPSNATYDDWVLEGNYLVSGTALPIVFRFCANIVRVSDMDALFAEALAARIAMETCERLTQSDSKMGHAKQLYAMSISDARSINGIECGADEPPLDDYIATRL